MLSFFDPFWFYGMNEGKEVENFHLMKLGVCHIGLASDISFEF